MDANQREWWASKEKTKNGNEIDRIDEMGDNELIVGFCATAFRLNGVEAVDYAKLQIDIMQNQRCQTTKQFSVHSSNVAALSRMGVRRVRVHFIVNTSIIRVRIRQQSIWNGVCFHELFIVLKSSQVINAPEQKTAEKENSRSRCDKRMC